jgi:predicted adenine nucleotide alpha hydrolase (AANH) superfamily ATPase
MPGNIAIVLTSEQQLFSSKGISMALQRETSHSAPSTDDVSSSPADAPKPRLLLHACCAPCSSAVVERLVGSYDVTIYFYNPNIHPHAEYVKRRDELERWCKEVAGVKYVVAAYDAKNWMENIKGLEQEPERGRRCNRCFRLRLERAAEYARARGYAVFTTVLSISPHKRHTHINRLGMALGRRYGVEFYAANFKKQNGYKRSVELSREFGFYRQNYCGCVFSAAQTQGRARG